jgi:DNA polymerase III subunit delta'
MLFKDIPSNLRAKKHLLRAIQSGRLSHAHLFLGEDGSSNLAMAWAFAQYIMCSDPQEEDSCGSCPSCLKVAKLSHPDLHWVFPVVSGRGSNPISDHFVADWRDAIQENSYLSEEDWYAHIGSSNKQGFISVHEANELNKKTILKPYEGSYRVIMIWHAEKMHGPTANKLLKLLEEPPEKTIFILLTTQAENLLETIVSRLQSIQIDPTDESNLSLYLQNQYHIPKNTADDTARLSEGNVGKAIQFIVGNEALNQNTQEFQIWMRMCYQAKIVDLSSWIDSLNSWGREKQKGFLQYALHMVRESLIQNFGDHNIKKVREEEHAFTEKFAPFIHQNNAIEIIEEIELAYQHIARNGSAKIIFMDLTLKMVVLLRVKSINLHTIQTN